MLDLLPGVFELTVMGKNGVTVNGVLHTPSSAPQQLYTQDFLQVGEQKFFFLLPKGTSRYAWRKSTRVVLASLGANGRVLAQ